MEPFCTDPRHFDDPDHPCVEQGEPVTVEITERGERIIDEQAYQQARDRGVLDEPSDV